MCTVSPQRTELVGITRFLSAVVLSFVRAALELTAYTCFRTNIPPQQDSEPPFLETLK